jgi:D-amino peptidase
VVRDLIVNGKSVGEGGLNTLLASWYGVPVVLITGDDVAVAQVKEVATAARTVAVKRAINPRAVELRPLDEARRDIEQVAREAVAAARHATPQRSVPINVQMQFKTTLIPEVVEAFPTIKRPAPDTVSFTSDSMPAAYRIVRVLYRFIDAE